MMARIAVENGLDHIARKLKANGHDPVSIDQAGDCDCAIITGQDKDIMGVQERATDVPVINAEGLTEEEVMNRVRERVRS